MIAIVDWSPELVGIVMFWTGILQCAWTFGLYPASIYLLARFHPQNHITLSSEEKFSVTVLIAAHNEEDRIRDRIKNILQCEYPESLLDILVVSDGSSDFTAQVVKSLALDRVAILERRNKSGKPACLNMAAAKATGDLLLFADARQTFAADAIKKLVRHFNDSSVVAVSGQLFPHGSIGGAAKGIDFYWKLEKSLRNAEAKYDSCIGCTGAIYAMRRESYSPIPQDTLLDDVIIPMQAVTGGRRVLFDAEARAYDPQRLDVKREKYRKARTLAGNFQMLFRYPEWLLPWKSRLWWKLASHKYSRLFTPVSLVTILAGNLILKDVPFYFFALCAQVSLYLLAIVGIAFRNLRSPLFSVPAGFLFLSWMIVWGFVYYISGGYKSGWGKSG